MFNVTFSSAKDVLNARARIEKMCDDLNIRIGKSHKNAESILCAAIGAQDYNAVVASAEQHKEEIAPLMRVSERPEKHEAPQSPRPLMLSADMLKNKTPRTLLYGYNTDRETFHVYLDESGVIHHVLYRPCYWHKKQPSELPFSTKPGNCIYHKASKEHEASTLRPNKRAYPDATDSEFTDLLQSLSMTVIFTSDRGGEPKLFEGFRIEELTTPSQANRQFIHTITNIDKYACKLIYRKAIGSKYKYIGRHEIDGDEYVTHPDIYRAAMEEVEELTSACRKAATYLQHDQPLTATLSAKLLSEIHKLEVNLNCILPVDLMGGVNVLKALLKSESEK